MLLVSSRNGPFDGHDALEKSRPAAVQHQHCVLQHQFFLGHDCYSFEAPTVTVMKAGRSWKRARRIEANWVLTLLRKWLSSGLTRWLQGGAFRCGNCLYVSQLAFAKEPCRLDGPENCVNRRFAGLCPADSKHPRFCRHSRTPHRKLAGMMSVIPDGAQSPLGFC